MGLDETIRRVENEIDTAFRASKLVDIGYTQAVWTLLSVNEDYFLKYLHVLPKEELHIFADVHLNALTYPLRACLERCKVDHRNVQRKLIDDHYKLARDWLEAAKDYSQFCSIFPLWYRRRIDITVSEEGRLIVDNPSNPNKAYEAYNRLIRKEGRQEPHLAPPEAGLVGYLLSNTTVKEDWFRVNFNPKLVSRLVSFISPAMAVRHTLPDDWQFNTFSLEEYRRIFLTLRSMLYGWHIARTVLAQNGLRGLGYKSSVWVITHEELARRLNRYTEIDPRIINGILSLITFGSNKVRSPDIAIQPLLDLKNGYYALSPFVWLNTDMERNLCVLLNQIPEERDAYLRLANEKEAATRKDIMAFLAPYGLEFRTGQVEGTDLDLAIVDRTDRVCLCLELKWFIEPAEIREIEERTEALATGVVQAKKIRALFERGDARFVQGSLGIDQDYLFLTAVASKNWIGFGDVQDPNVPIIKVWHFLNRMREVGSLADVVSWLKNREYLPRQGIDFSIEPMEVWCGNWTAIWYGIRPLHEGLD